MRAYLAAVVVCVCVHLHLGSDKRSFCVMLHHCCWGVTMETRLCE
uniref:Uncharacterized protein n=1 Tax=Anopheles minimus TaxID=112268 RepID=A0A182WQ44_9DIPT